MKIALSTAIALLVFSGAAFADRSKELRETDTYDGQYMVPSTAKRLKIRGHDVFSLRGIESPRTTNRTSYDREQRRLDEKNGYNG